MSNQVILWSTLIIPWVTLLLMPKNDIKRYISFGLLSLILCIISFEAGIRFSWWSNRESTFPFSVIPTYSYGLFPVLPMWLLKFTYGRFVLYLVIDTLFNTIFAFVIFPWFAHRGIIIFNAPFIALILETIIAISLYGFYKWQKDIFVQS